jgi:ribose 5-phosphate isomerase A
MDSVSLAKKNAAEKAVEFVKDGDLVGLGTGSTAEWAIKKLGELVKEGLDIQGVPSSKAIDALAQKVDLPLIPYEEFIRDELALNIDIDGADCVDPDFNLIKGGGGAHTREKRVANASEMFYCVVDEKKLVDKLAGSFPLPVEVMPEDLDEAVRGLRTYGFVKQRQKDGKLFISDNANYILDVSLNVGEPVKGLEVDINNIPGVVDNGLFTIRRPDAVIVGRLNGEVTINNG